MCQLVIFFRGRNTSRVMNDAHSAGVLDPGDRVVVISRKDDTLAEAGDVSPGWDGRYGVPLEGYQKLVVVANGGTTAQQAPLLFRLGELEGASGVEAAWDWQQSRENEYVPLEVFDLQQDASPVSLGKGLLNSRYSL